VAFWATVGLVVVVLYLLSIGPVAWTIRQPWCPLWLYGSVQIIYSPIGWLEENGPQPIRTAIGWYGDFWH
jgi:hypothetical protein